MVSNGPINDYKFLIDEVKYNKEIIDASHYITIQGLISSSYESKGVSIIGIDADNETNMSIDKPTMANNVVEKRKTSFIRFKVFIT